MDDKKDPMDILDEIMNRPEKPRTTPAAPPPKFDPPAPADSPPPPAPEKKPLLAERLIPWLCALLGGAVLALALCGMQLFSVNTRLDGLQAAVEEIRAVDELRAENETLKENYQTSESARKEAEAQAEELGQEVIHSGMLLESARLDRQKGQMLAWLERFVREGDYLMAAVGIESFNSWYDWNWKTPPTGGQPPLPGQQARYRELRQEVLERSDYLLAEPNPRATEENPMLWITLNEDAFGPGEWDAAQKLWVILYYPTDELALIAAGVEWFYQHEDMMGALKGGAFRPSTLELLEQIKDNLIVRGWLEEDENGRLTVITHYGEGEEGFVPLVSRET